MEALAHPCWEARRLLNKAESWATTADVLPAQTAVPARSSRVMRQLRAQEIDALVEAYQRGSTVYELAKQFGIHRSTVGKHLRGRGIDTTPPGLVPEHIPTAAALYEDGWSLARIAEKFGCTAHTVRSRLIERGVIMRSPHDRAL